MRRLPVLALVLAAGLSVAGCDIQAGNGDFNVRFRLGKAPTPGRGPTSSRLGPVRADQCQRQITAEPTDGAEVVVEGRRTVKASSDEAAKELLAKLEIREEVGESTVRVESRPPRLSGFSGSRDRMDGQGAEGRDRRPAHHQRRRAPQRLCERNSREDHEWRREGLNIIPGLIEASAVNGGVSSISARRSMPRFGRHGNGQRRCRAVAAEREQGDDRGALRQWRRAGRGVEICGREGNQRLRAPPSPERYMNGGGAERHA